MELIHQLLPEHVLQALGWAVLHSLWQAFAVALLLAAYLLAWQKTDARKRYAAGNAALATVLLLAAATFAYYLRQCSPEPELLSEIRKADGTVLGRIFTEGEPSFFADYFTEHMPIIVTVWALGLVFFMLRMLGGLLYVQRLKTRMTSPLPRHWQEHMARLCEAMSLRRPVQLLESALAQSPMVLGWLKPVILLPVGAVNHLTPAQVEAILAHELAHVLRHDYLLNLLQSVVETLFYFNPAVWWVSAQVRSERENCCDDIAVRLCGSSLAYAKALVGLQEMQALAPVLAMPFSRSKNQLLQRIERILQPSQNKSNLMEKFTATLLLTVAVMLLSVQANTPFGNFLNRVVSEGIHRDVDAPAPMPDHDEETYLAEMDTVPPGGHRNTHIHYNSDDEQIEFEMEDDEITYLKVDGEVIPPDKYEEYEAHVRELAANVPLPPDPPAMPGFPDMPAPPAPPAPPSFFHGIEPVAPLAPLHGGQRKIITQKDRNGTTFIIETTDGAEPVEITVGDGKKGTIIVNGQEITGLKKGDKTIIMQDVPGGSAYFWGGDDALAPHGYHFEFPEPASAYAWSADELRAFEDAWQSHELAAEQARELVEQAREMQNSSEWRAQLEEQRALLEAQMSELRAQQEALMEQHREQMDRALDEARKAQRMALEQERKALEKEREMKKKGKSKM